MKKIVFILAAALIGAMVSAPGAQAVGAAPFTACESTVITWGVTTSKEISPKMKDNVTARVRSALEEFTEASGGRYQFAQVSGVELSVAAMDPEYIELNSPMLGYEGAPLVSNKYADITVLVAPFEKYTAGSQDVRIGFGPRYRVSDHTKWVRASEESDAVRVRGSILAEISSDAWTVKGINRQAVIYRLLGMSMGIDGVEQVATKDGLSTNSEAAVAEAATKSCELVRQNPGVSSNLPNITGGENLFRSFDGIL